jgi:hypothetical protein
MITMHCPPARPLAALLRLADIHDEPPSPPAPSTGLTEAGSRPDGDLDPGSLIGPASGANGEVVVNPGLAVAHQPISARQPSRPHGTAAPAPAAEDRRPR